MVIIRLTADKINQIFHQTKNNVTLWKALPENKYKYHPAATPTNWSDSRGTNDKQKNMPAKRTEIAELGEFGLIERLTCQFPIRNASTVLGAGDDAAVIDAGERYLLLSSDMLLEGVNFDLVYFPLKHLGYKAVVVGINDIYAMNGTPEQLTVCIGVSAKFSVEDLEELYSGIRSACEDYRIDLVGGDTTASVNGLAISVSVAGSVDKDKIAYRSGARVNDIVCITGDLGAAYMGLHLLEREKRAFAGNDSPQPQFEGYEYLLRRQLKPTAAADTVASLRSAGIVPTSMIDLSDGLASDMLQICKNSGCGVRLYLERIPIARETHKMAEELHADPVVAALNGGDDNELLFTVPVTQQAKIAGIGGIDIIGHITPASTGTRLVTPDGSELSLTAPGFREQ